MDRHGLNPKKGLLLYGPPGCSKTMTAKAAATESGLNFIAVRGPELMSMYVGESERAIREVFSKARAVSPSILFFDEIDAIGATGENGQHSSVNTVTTLLNELDGFQELKGVFVLAATNRPDKLDPALIRAGRLDTTIYVGLPDLAARREILTMRMRTMYLSDDIDTVALSEATEGFSGAEITNVCQKAGYVAVREEMTTGEKQKVGQVHFNVAMAQVEKSITPEIIKRYEAWAAGRH
jgi:AAA family ATPase